MIRGYFDLVQLIVLREREENWGNLAIWIIENFDILEIIIKIAPLENSLIPLIR